MIGLAIMLVLILAKVQGRDFDWNHSNDYSVFRLGVTNLSGISFDIGGPFRELPTTFGAAFGGIRTLFDNPAKMPIALLAIFAFSLTDTFDTIGTFVGTGRKTGIFTDEDLAAMETSTGFKTKMEKSIICRCDCNIDWGDHRNFKHNDLC